MAASIYENLVMNECCIFEWGSNYKPDGDKLTDYQSSYRPWKDNPVDHVTPLSGHSWWDHRKFPKPMTPHPSLNSL